MRFNPEPRGIALVACAVAEFAAIAGAFAGAVEAETLVAVSSAVTVVCFASIAIDLIADSRMRDMRRRGRR